MRAFYRNPREKNYLEAISFSRTASYVSLCYAWKIHPNFSAYFWYYLDEINALRKIGCYESFRLIKTLANSKPLREINR